MNKKDLLQKTVLDKIKDYFRCSAILGTGSGKTLLIFKDIEKHLTDDCLFLIVVSKNPLIKGIKEEIIKHNKKHLLNHIRFVNYRSLFKADPTLYDKIYLDECHNLKFTHEQFLVHYKGPILGLTGTYPKYMNSESGRMCKKYCPAKIKFRIEKAIQEKMLNDYRIYIHYLELSKLPVVKTKNGFMSEHNNYKMWNNILERNPTQMTRILRMKAIQNFDTKPEYAKMLLSNLKEKTIIFTESIKHAEFISNNTYHSKSKNGEETLENFEKGLINDMATVQMISEGKNIPNLKNCIVLHSYSNERTFAQRLGRMLRLNPNELATIHLLVYKNTIDEEWAKKALTEFNKQKIFIWKKT